MNKFSIALICLGISLNACNKKPYVPQSNNSDQKLVNEANAGLSILNLKIKQLKDRGVSCTLDVSDSDLSSNSLTLGNDAKIMCTKNIQSDNTL